MSPSEKMFMSMIDTIRENNRVIQKLQKIVRCHSNMIEIAVDGLGAIGTTGAGTEFGCIAADFLLRMRKAGQEIANLKSK